MVLEASFCNRKLSSGGFGTVQRPVQIDRGARSMVREYHKGYSSQLGREMELLIFGTAGLPVMVFPTSCGRFYEFEDRGMIAAFADKIDAG
jgi:hypothetical protein